MRRVLGFAILMVSASVYAQAHKCPDGKGGTVYQQMPCAGSGGLVGDEVRTREAAAREARKRKEADDEAQRKADAASNARFDLNKVKKDCGTTDIPERPVPGMTEAQMFNCTWIGRSGTLDLVDTTEVVGAVLKMYEGRLGSVKYVHTRNGIVVNVRH